MRVGGMMDEIGYGKWGRWRGSLCILLCFVAASTITSQPGFLSIDCGTKINRTDINNITWVGDADYIEVGQTADIGNATEEFYGSYLTSLRFFPRPLNKSCYSLPVDPHVPYLVRLWFSVGNFSRFQKMPNFAFSLETKGTLYMRNITNQSAEAIHPERILTSSGKVLHICLIRTLESDDPFISAIELRKLQNGMYGQPQPGTILKTIRRTDVGGSENSIIRYPQDTFDRIWTPFVPLNVSSLDIGKPVSSDSTLINNTKDLPPPLVMQTAWVLNNSEPAQFSLGPFDEGGSKSLLVLYFAEIETLDKSESRSFYVMINGEKGSDTITLPRSYSALELRIPTNQTDDFQFAFVMATNYTLPPIINALEYYTVFDTQPATYLQDVEALVAMKEMFDMSAWISDPCFLVEWDGIACNHDSSAIRISEINLSKRNMTGLIPEQIGQLTALVNMVLDNNHFTGSLPDFSNLTMLQRLHLGNNNLNGSVPDWLSELQNLKELVLDNNHLMGPLPDLSNLTMLEKLHLQNNLLNGSVPNWLCELKHLKELFIENNNFSGEIAPQLLQKHSLKLKYSGNTFLFIPDLIGHTPQNPNKKLIKYLVLGIALGGVLIILIVGIALYPKKKECVTTESNGVEMIVHSAPNEWIDPTNMVPNSAKAYAFTLDQVTAATGKFSGNIGKGGFGTVFFGKLPEGTDIAVKVLTLFSTQGVKQFLNEIDVLSRVQHENLVSLLGYCNESQELMIIYEYMSGGSLRDRLYGPNAGSELSWKTRVKIALDAAQGLEYLHTVCTPKIIHRDVKAANILLDSNLKGKLGDFGISRIWTAGEASHVTTMVKGTAGYLDPEYFSTERLTEKSDVYSFGVVLLEIICGRQPIDAKLSLDKLNIIRWATPFVEMDAIPGKIEEIIDERLGGNYDIKSVTRVAKVAMRCVKAEPFYRPSVSEVVAELREALQIEGNCTTISNVLS